MKPTLLYAILLPLVYALLFWLGNNDHDTQSLWYDEAAPWLGEPPAELSSETIRAAKAEELPCTEFRIPANEAFKQHVISTFRLKESEPGIYRNQGTHAIYPQEKEVILEVFVVLYPILKVSEDGSMTLCINNPNQNWCAPDAAGEALEIPCPQYLPGMQEGMLRSLALAMLCFVLPAAFCCIGWLWIQRRPIRSQETVNICLLIPAAIAFIGAWVDFNLHGFHADYTRVSAFFAVVTNLVTAGLLIALTALARWMWSLIAPRKEA